MDTPENGLLADEDLGRDIFVINGIVKKVHSVWNKSLLHCAFMKALLERICRKNSKLQTFR